jgi:hypothetical protein
LLSPDSQWRIDLARQIATKYSAEAIMLVGSPVMGLSDAYSDVDILMFWDTIPDENIRRKLITSLSGRIREMRDGSPDANDPALQNLEDMFHLGAYDLKIDITHITIASQQKLIDDVVLRYDTHYYKMGAMYGLSHSMALSGESLIAKWQAEIRFLPDALKQKLMQQYTQMWAYPVLEKLLIARDDVLYANRIINEICEKVVYMLVIANAQYPPIRLKHLPYIIESLEHKPPNLLKRITQICSLSPTEALPIAVQLVEDSFNIITTLGYDINNARTHFKSERQANTQSISINKEINNA